MAYYLISLKYSYRHEKYITLWRPNNAGYCYSKERAGVYEELQKGYHDSENTMPITVEFGDTLFEKGRYDDEERLMILNTKENLDKLGLRRNKGELVRRKRVLV